MTTYFISSKIEDVDNVKTFKRFAGSLTKIVKPGDIIEVLPGKYGDDLIEFNGSSTSHITIKGEGEFDGIHLKGQYLDVTFNCERLYLTNCLNVTLISCNLFYVHGYNIAKVTFFNVKSDLVDILNGTENVIADCTIDDINIDCCNQSFISNNVANNIMLTGEDPLYDLGIVKDNKCDNIMVNNGVINS